MTKIKVIRWALPFLLLISLNNSVATETVKLTDYWFGNGAGDVWTYGYTFPPGVQDFTVTITLLTEGDYAGKYRMGDYRYPDGSTEYRIADWVGDWFYLYYDSEHGAYEPPAALYTVYPLETLIDMGEISLNCPWYFKKMASLTVPAGTYKDILLHIVVDMSFGPTKANDDLGLDRDLVPYGVTHANWYARGVGELQNKDFDADGNVVYEYQLKSTNVNPKSKMNPGSLLLLLDQ